MNFELFCPELEAALRSTNRSRGSKPPYDALLVFRMLTQQALYTYSDDQERLTKPVLVRYGWHGQAARARMISGR